MAGTPLRALLATALALLLLPGAQAQEPNGAQGQQPSAAPFDQSKSGTERAQRAAERKGSDTGGQPAAPAAGDAGLRQRVEQLEEQLVDLQVVIGTLESLARPGATDAAARPPFHGSDPGGLPAGESSRLDGMETQIRALTSQLEQLSEQVRAQGGQPRRSDAANPPFDAARAPYAGGPPPPETGRFGSTTVASGQDDPIGGLIPDASGAPKGTADLGPSDRPQPPDGALGPVAAATPVTGVVDGGNPKQLYETAYGYLLQQDYGAAQAGFADFLKRYPKDPLAPNALYWLGETHYVQKNFIDAAEAFDLVTSSYSQSAKAPDAQLKRAMAMAQLGKKEDACQAFRRLGSNFPNAPAHVKAKAESERRRVGCP